MKAPPVSRPPLRVLVVSADPLARSALAQALLGEGLDAVAQPGDPVALAARHRPEAALWDLGLDGKAGLEALRQGLPPEVPTVALLPAGVGAGEALAVGACGALPRDTRPEAVAAAVRAAALGLAVVEAAALAELGRAPAAAEPGAEALTPREREVLALVVEGLSNKAIAQRLQISEHTAKFHVNAILTKLGAQRRVEAVVRAARLGLVDL